MGAVRRSRRASHPGARCQRGRSLARRAESAALPAGASLDGPLVAHVKNLSTGEIGVYMGTSEVTFRDPHLAAKLYRAVG